MVDQPPKGDTSERPPPDPCPVVSFVGRLQSKMAPLQACMKEAGDCRTRDDFENHTKAIGEAMGGLRSQVRKNIKVVHSPRLLIRAASWQRDVLFLYLGSTSIILGDRKRLTAYVSMTLMELRYAAVFVTPPSLRSIFRSTATPRLCVVGDDVPAGGAPEGHGGADDRGFGLLGQQGPDAVPQDEPRTGEEEEKKEEEKQEEREEGYIETDRQKDRKRERGTDRAVQTSFA